MLRLILIIIFFLGSLLTVFPAPILFCWYVAILVTEFPWVFIAATLLLVIWGFGIRGTGLAGTMLGTFALVLFLRPIVGAHIISTKLDESLQEAFGKYEINDAVPAFNVTGMITGINAPQLPYKTLIYTPAGIAPLTLDYYAAQQSDNRPCVVVVHGGSWAGGTSQQLPELNSYLAKAGYNVATINYRLAPEFKSPSQVEDLHVAVDYLKRNAQMLNIDTSNLVLLGRSAGGQIVLEAAYTFNDPCIKGVVSYYGPADMIWGYQHPANRMVYHSCEVLENYIGGTYSAMPQKYADASPVLAVTPRSVPTLLIQGKLDVLVAYQHSPRLVEKLNADHVPNYLLSLPWATHGCDYTLNGPSGQLATYAVSRFLEKVCK
ncbi:MAG: alpha/beta hydrolase [Flavipsychrobacter sp.]|nr:alpha/beta hydrolase [Flavipsychrobacter sp.]